MSKNQDDARARVLELILDATLQPESWNDVIDQLCRSIGASSGAIAIRSKGPSLDLIDPVAATWPSGAVEAYLSYPRERDPVIVELTRKMFAARDRKSFITQELIDEPDYRETPFFHEFSDLFDIPFLAGVSFDVGAEHFGTLMLYRESGTSVFGRDERHFLESIARPLQRGLEVRRRLKAGGVARGVLERLTTPVVTLNEGGCVDYANPAAERLLARGDVVKLCAGRLRTSSTAVNKQLDALSLDAVRGDICRHGDKVLLRGQDGAAPLHALFLPLSHELSSSLWGGDVPVAVFVLDTGDETQSDVGGVLRRTYRLTEKEAEIALLYTEGATRRTIAEQLGRSEETIKTYLERIYEKTRARGKTKLTRLVQALPRPLA